MAVVKAPVFTEEGTIGNPELLHQLNMAIEELSIKMRATVPIHQGTRRVGFGVNKTQRGIAADSVIAIAKAIKSSKGW